MRYSLYINQVRALEWGLNLPQCAVLSVVCEASSWADGTLMDGEIYYWFAKSKLLSELPMVTDKEDTIVRHLKSLEKLGIIKLKVVIKDKMHYQYIALTAKGKLWNAIDQTAPIPDNTGTSEGRKNIREPESNEAEIYPEDGNISEEPRKIIRETSEKNPTNYITSNTKTNDPNSLVVPPKPKKPKRASAVPDEFLVDQRMLDWLTQNQITNDWRIETNKFLDYHRAKGSKMLDWIAAWRLWMRNSMKFAAQRPTPPAVAKQQVQDSLTDIHDTDW